MNPQVITYLILILSGIYAINRIFGFIRAKRQAETFYFRPLRLAAAIIVFFASSFCCRNEYNL